MLTNTPFVAPSRAVYAPCAHQNHRATPSTAAPVGWTRPAPREGAERRAEGEAARVAHVLETRADVAARLRAAADRRTAERKARQAEKDAATQRKIAEREAAAARLAGIREYYRDMLTPEALKLARAQYHAREKAEAAR